MVCCIVFGCVLDYSDPYDTKHQSFRIHDSEPSMPRTGTRVRTSACKSGCSSRSSMRPRS